jgi:hypothetical protein
MATRMVAQEKAALTEVVRCIEAFIAQMESGTPIITASEILSGMGSAKELLEEIGDARSYPSDPFAAFSLAVAVDDAQAADLFARYVFGQQRARELIEAIEDRGLRDEKPDSLQDRADRDQ